MGLAQQSRRKPFDSSARKRTGKVGKAFVRELETLQIEGLNALLGKISARGRTHVISG
jgi:hypothetical protein